MLLQVSCSQRCVEKGLDKRREVQLRQWWQITINDEISGTDGVIIVNDSLLVVEIVARHADNLRKNSVTTTDIALNVNATHRVVAARWFCEASCIEASLEWFADNHAVEELHSKGRFLGGVHRIVISLWRAGIRNKGAGSLCGDVLEEHAEVYMPEPNLYTA